MKKYIWRDDENLEEKEYVELSKDVNWILTVDPERINISFTYDPVMQVIHIRGKGRDSLTDLIHYLKGVNDDIRNGYTGFVEE